MTNPQVLKKGAGPGVIFFFSGNRRKAQAVALDLKFYLFIHKYMAVEKTEWHIYLCNKNCICHWSLYDTVEFRFFKLLSGSEIGLKI